MALIIDGNEIVLSGMVGGEPDGDDFWFADGFSASDVIGALAQVGRTTDIVVRLNSGGGIATEGAAIYAALNGHKGSVHIVVEGVAASAASLLAMAADRLTMSPGAIMMIHDPSGFTFGDAEAHQKTTDALNALGDSYAGIYAERSGKTVEEARALMKAETWMTPAEAVAAGFADDLGAANENEPEPTAFAYGTYAKAPERFVALANARGWKPRTVATARITAAKATFKKGDRVKVKGDPHMKGQDVGTIEIVSSETPYAIKFDGMDEIHKWYVDSELERAPADDGGDKSMAAPAAPNRQPEKPTMTKPTEAGNAPNPENTPTPAPEPTPAPAADPVADAAAIASICAGFGMSADKIEAFIKGGGTVEQAKARATEATEIRAAVALASKVNPAIKAEKADEFIAQGFSLEKARSALLGDIVAKQSPEITPAAPPPPSVSETANAGWDKAVARANARIEG